MNTPKEITQVPTETLVPYVLNARRHSDHQITQIASSIREFGFTNPILIDERNNVIAGHGRLEAAKRLELPAVPCVRLSHLTDLQRKAYILVDNKLALNSAWDDELLKIEIEDLKMKNFDTDLLGWIQLPEFEIKPDYSDLMDAATDEEAAEMSKEVKKAIQIEFELEHYEEAAELVKFWRDQDGYVGGMIIGFLRAEKNKLAK
jgi:hypothetical protein